MKILCVMLVILQSFFMDVVIITCYGDGDSSGDVCEPCQNCWWWIAGDIIICILFVVTLSISYKHLAYHSKCKQLHKHYLKGGLPLSCVTWFVYSSAVAAKVIETEEHTSELQSPVPISYAVFCLKKKNKKTKKN